MIFNDFVDATLSNSNNVLSSFFLVKSIRKLEILTKINGSLSCDNYLILKYFSN